MNLLYCQRCGGVIGDLDQHPYARMCADCRQKSCAERHKKLMRKPRPPRVCRKCGAVISDLSTHPHARICLSCRALKRAPYTPRCATDYTDIVREYLNRVGWLEFIRPLYMIETDKIVREALGLTEDDLIIGNAKRAMALRHLYAGVNQIVGPNGERYVRWGKTSKVYVIVIPGASAEEATA